MVYECEHCGYTTTRKANLLRHKNRKNSCRKTKDGYSNQQYQPFENEQNISLTEQNISLIEQNISLTEQNISSSKINKYTCKLKMVCGSF